MKNWKEKSAVNQIEKLNKKQKKVPGCESSAALDRIIPSRCSRYTPWSDFSSRRLDDEPLKTIRKEEKESERKKEKRREAAASGAIFHLVIYWLDQIEYSLYRFKPRYIRSRGLAWRERNYFSPWARALARSRLEHIPTSQPKSWIKNTITC